MWKALEKGSDKSVQQSFLIHLARFGSSVVRALAMLSGDPGSGVNILHKWVKLFPDGHFHAHKLFPEMMRESRLLMGYSKSKLF